MLWFRENDDGYYQMGYRIYDGLNRYSYVDTHSLEVAEEIVRSVNQFRAQRTDNAPTERPCQREGESQWMTGQK